MAIPQIPYDREKLIEALKSGAETIINNAEFIIPHDTIKLRGLTASVNITAEEVATVHVNYDMLPDRFVYPYRNYEKDKL